MDRYPACRSLVLDLFAHSITRSAPTSAADGKLLPNAFAVLT
jgi:hypothetical protein